MPQKKTKKKAKKRAKTANKARSRSTPDPLGQVKDLLFGAEITAQRQRTRTAELRLQKKVEKQSGALAERVTKLSARVTRTKQGLDESIEQLRKDSARLHREMKQEFTAALEQMQTETAELLERFEERMQAVLNGVRQSSADRETLAALFEDFARRLVRGKSSKPR